MGRVRSGNAQNGHYDQSRCACCASNQRLKTELHSISGGNEYFEGSKLDSPSQISIIQGDAGSTGSCIDASESLEPRSVAI
jgi:hypothetical protein